MNGRAIGVALCLAACAGQGTGLAGSTSSRAVAGAYSLEVIDEAGQQLPTYEQRGRTYILGLAGQRYQVRVRNHSGTRIEAIISVDGRDALDGRPANWGKRGYLVDAYGEVTVGGFRLNMENVATFRFSSVRDSYAAKMGNARDVGVIGVAIFPERAPIHISERDFDALEGFRYGEPSARSKGAAPAAPSLSEEPTSRESGSARADSAQPEALRKHAPPMAAKDRPGLGTAFGEQRESRVYETEFVRARPGHPDHLLALRYNDRQGLIALGIDVDGTRPVRWELRQRESAQPFRNSCPHFSAPPAGWSPSDP